MFETEYYKCDLLLNVDCRIEAFQTYKKYGNYILIFFNKIFIVFIINDCFNRRNSEDFYSLSVKVNKNIT